MTMKHIHQIRIFLIFLALATNLFNPELKAQNNGEEINRCATMEYLEMRLKENPELENNLKIIEQKTQKWIRENASSIAGNKDVIVIPVVVHVVYNTPEQNISDAQILSQIEVLNQDYRRLNADAVNTPSFFDPVAADCQIEFCLARRTPEDSASSGIIRVTTTVETFSLDNKVKFDSLGGSNAWDRDKYLNIWVCKLGGGVLGYASWPGDSPEVDGIVVRYQSFGKFGSAQAPYHMGRTCTHEVGHWLNLLHPWGNWGGCNDDDYVSDTPLQEGPHYYCPVYPQPSCSDTSDMFMDYMDYVNDSCMNLFTFGQKARMLATMDIVRTSLKSSNGCQPVIGINENHFIRDIRIFPNPSNGIVNVVASIPVPAEVEFVVYDLLGNAVFRSSTASSKEINLFLDLTSLPSGVYFLKTNCMAKSRVDKIFILR